MARFHQMPGHQTVAKADGNGAGIGHCEDNFLRDDARDFPDGATVIGDVFKNFGAEHGSEAAVCERGGERSVVERD